MLEKNYEGGGGSYTQLSDKKLSADVVPTGVNVEKVSIIQRWSPFLASPHYSRPSKLSAKMYSY